MVTIKNSLFLEKARENLVSAVKTVGKEPETLIINDQEYLVESLSNRGVFYLVNFIKGTRNVDCACKAGQDQLVCVHVVVAYDLHMDRIKERTSDGPGTPVPRPLLPPAPKNQICEHCDRFADYNGFICSACKKEEDTRNIPLANGRSTTRVA